MTALLTIDTFRPHLNTGFSVGEGKYADVLTLVEVLPSKFDGAIGLRLPFILIFHGQRTDIRFEAQVLPLTHPMLGTLMIDTVPLSRLSGGNVEYQAVFN